ncbi:phage terminase large subunit family protein [Escherichia coli]
MSGIICDPADMLVVQMTETKAREHSRTRLSRTFRHSPEVSKRLSPSRNDNNVHDKMFLDGSFLKIGWPSDHRIFLLGLPSCGADGL